MLRGINVSGQKRVPMEELRKCYESLGFGRVRTYIQSGNVVFEHQGANAQNLTDKIESVIKRTFGFDVLVVIKTKEEMLRVIKNLPFTGLDESKMHVTFLSSKPSDIPTKEIEAAKSTAEKVSVSGREVYLYCPNGYGKTKLSNSFLERKLGTAATTRNWRTVNALYDLASN